MVDGQTVQLRVDLGFRKTLEAVFKLDRMKVVTDTEPKASAARAQLEAWIKGRQVIVQSANLPGYPVEMWLPGDPVSVNEKMIAARQAVRA
ncbi:MAG TPA: hypothetical protein VJ547_12180 [Candidatus Thermoplasmatota archaeon]|nr:hypothetical protein [Candidatus Thermoplasmatota archaeon]